jgi:succinyl-diaminopimelate desuccinylase
MTFRPAQPAAFLEALIRCPSVTPVEGGALAYLADVLGRAGFRVERPTFSEPGTPDVENLFATIGSGSPHFVFAGHTDVVPPGDESRWRHPPFAAVREGDFIYGRGAVDMKGGIAAFLVAVLAHLGENGPHGAISLLITGDEEGPSVNGTAKLLDWCRAQGHRFDLAIVGEPTSQKRLGDMIKIGRRGSLTGTITVRGRQGHVAYPHLADNPLPKLVRMLARLIESELDRGSPHFQPSNLELVTIDTGNPAVNLIPAEVRARFNVRFNDHWTRVSLERHIRAVLDEAGSPYALTIEKGGSDSFFTAAPALVDRLAEAIRAVTGLTPELSTSGGTSDARFIKDYCPVVEFGLLGETLHAVDERVAIADLDRLAAIYRRFLDDLFGTAGHAVG